MVARLTIGPTELKDGFIYELHNAPRDDTPRKMIIEAGLADLIADESNWIVSPGPSAKGTRAGSNATVVGRVKREVERYKCSLNRKHGRINQPFDYELDISYVQRSIPPFVNDTEGAHVLVNQWLAERLKSSGLKGFRLIPTSVRDLPIWYVNERTTPLAKIYQLSFEGRFPKQVRHVEPPSADRCPNCGAGPIVCPECGYCMSPCYNCDEPWGVAADLHGGARDRRIAIEKLGASISVVDPRLWDGNDFMGWSTGGWITRRALDWFLSIHAGPFMAE